MSDKVKRGNEIYDLLTNFFPTNTLYTDAINENKYILFSKKKRKIIWGFSYLFFMKKIECLFLYEVRRLYTY